MGTGFFVSGDGHLATNGHIYQSYQRHQYITLYPVVNWTVYSDFLEVYLTEKTGKIVTKQEATNAVAQAKLSKDSLYQLGGIIVDLNQKNILKVGNESNKYFLQLGNRSTKITIEGVTPSENILEAAISSN